MINMEYYVTLQFEKPTDYGTEYKCEVSCEEATSEEDAKLKAIDRCLSWTKEYYLIKSYAVN